MRTRHLNFARPGPARSGYTLIELLVAIAILGIVFVSLYAGFSAGFAIIKLARENLRATQIMQEKMETIRLYTWEQINAPGFIPTNFVDAFYIDPTDGSLKEGITYTGNVTIAAAPITETYAPDLRLVTIQIGWHSSGVNRTREMQTLVTKHGLQKYVY